MINTTNLSLKITRTVFISVWPCIFLDDKYLVDLTDFSTKWVEAEAIPNTLAEQITRLFFKSISTHCCLTTLITDQRREFCNDLIDLVCKNMGTNHRIV